VRDTPPEVQKIYHTMLMARTGAARLRMGCDLFSTAKELVAASLAKKRPDEVREALFLRFYGSEFASAVRARIVSRLRAYNRHRVTQRDT
jgi:hypothetical protein